MPTTRALTARQTSASSSTSSSSSSQSPFAKPFALGGSSRTLRRSNSSSSLNSVLTSHSAVSSSACSSSSSSSSASVATASNPVLAKGRRGLPRTASAPNPNTTTTTSSSSSSSASAIRTRSTSGKPSASSSSASRPLSRSSSIRSLSSTASSTSRPSLSSTSDSDDEEANQPPTPPGGAPWSLPTSSSPDDSNKENVAPLWRSLEEADLMSEMSVEQNESYERRRGGRGSLRYGSRARQSSPGAASVASSSGAMTVASAPPTTSAPRSFMPRDRLSFTRVPSSSSISSQGSTTVDDASPSSSMARKRRRQPVEVDDEAENAGPSTRSAISRLRMARGQKRTAVCPSSESTSPSRGSQPMLRQATANTTEGDDYMSSSQGTASTMCDSVESANFDGPLTRSRSRSSTPATSAPSTPSVASPERKRMDLKGDDEGQSTEDAEVDVDIDSEPESELDAETVRGVEEPPTVVPVKPAARRFTNVYAHAKALLRYGGSNSSSSPSELTSSDNGDVSVAVESQIVGRVEERAFLQRFLHQRFGIFGHLESSASPDADASSLSSSASSSLEASGPGHAGALYISGLPGTGKTALVRSVVDDIKSAQLGAREPLVAFVNCVGLASPREIFTKVLRALLGGEEKSPDEAERCLAQVVAKADKRILIVLDEMDHLLRSRASQNMLYKLFALAASSSPLVPSSPSSQGTCALIGVANSLDLTQRFVPLLASKGAEPAVLHFRAFEAKEINTIVRVRLAGLKSRYDLAEEPEEDDDDDMMTLDSEDPMSKAPPILGAAALELASKKIAGGTGDLRKALDACRLAIDAVETEQRRRALAAPVASHELASPSSPSSSSKACNKADPLSHLTPESAPKVSPSHILKVLSAVLGSPQLTKVRSLGLHAKLVLLAYVIARKRAEAGLGLLGSSNGGAAQAASKAAASSEATTTLVVTSLRLQDVFGTYASLLRLDGEVFGPLSQAELLEIVDGLEVHGLVSLFATPNGSGSGAAKRGGGAGASNAGGVNRSLGLQMPIDEVLRGLTTPGSAGSTQSSSDSSSSASSAGGGSTGQAIVLSSLQRMWSAEESRIQRSKGWQRRVEEASRVRQEELGGGRGAVGRF